MKENVKIDQCAKLEILVFIATCQGKEEDTGPRRRTSLMCMLTQGNTLGLNAMEKRTC